MKRTLWLLGFILIHTTLLYSQKEGNKMYENLGYLTATDLYQDLENEDQTYEIKLKLANSKEQSSDKTLSFITDCEEIKKFNNHRDIELTNASALNSSAHDFSPIPYKDGIVFTSMRGQERGGNKAIDNWTKSNFSDLFYAAKKETSFDKPKAMKGDVNEGYHDGVATFSTPTKTMFFTRTSREKSEAIQIIGKIPKN